ncbi:hypothetical protein CRI94_01690 [Longibacter salinarum]|uniref:Glycosyltransferase n=1 Tax=Longibacter salinarum TaxID=1850348 RepID=A0A2A8D266_9BACT|nr:TIGR04282 family arsenosugar biosynthesis glycosyltransferase [Longibacter salinarum]PEN15025.1 hypothetical protein CRI94_01690 [Longibacter salinarum]
MSSSRSDSALLVFAKAPEPGRVKTRLAAGGSDLTESETAQLYTAFLKDALYQYIHMAKESEPPLDVQLHWAGDIAAASPFVDSHVSSRKRAIGHVDVREQEGEGLGERMKTAFAHAFDNGYERAVVIGTDHPTLPSAFIDEAFGAIREKKSICLGPSADGGYYLLGMNGFYPSVFEDMTYSHAHVFKNTLRRAAETEAETTILPEFYDVDTSNSLRHMLVDLRDTSVSAPNTRAATDELQLYDRFDVNRQKQEASAENHV